MFKKLFSGLRRSTPSFLDTVTRAELVREVELHLPAPFDLKISHETGKKETRFEAWTRHFEKSKNGELLKTVCRRVVEADDKRQESLRTEEWRRATCGMESRRLGAYAMLCSTIAKDKKIFLTAAVAALGKASKRVRNVKEREKMTSYACVLAFGEPAIDGGVKNIVFKQHCSAFAEKINAMVDTGNAALPPANRAGQKHQHQLNS